MIENKAPFRMYCDKCGKPVLTTYRINQQDICPYCVNNTMQIPMEIPNKLTEAFEPPSKTLKLKVKDGTLLEDAVKHAHAFLHSPENKEVTRIEFKHGSSYIVIAKLRE